LPFAVALCCGHNTNCLLICLPSASVPCSEDGKEETKGDKKGDAGKEAKCPDHFVKLIHGAVSDYQVDWQDIDESTNFFQKYDPELVRKALKPVVFEEIRVEVDEEMRVLLENLKDMAGGEGGRGAWSHLRPSS
jgi:hypothetical protein